MIRYDPILRARDMKPTFRSLRLPQQTTAQHIANLTRCAPRQGTTGNYTRLFADTALAMKTA